jgi:uncharacterized protein YutE (UPF0331/DUF86 family)
MYDIERINSIIGDINRFFSDLQIVGLNEKNLESPDKLHASSMLIFGIINRTIDLAEEILVKNDLEMPNSYSDCFPTLAKAGLIDKKLASSLESLAKQRGFFAHHYYDLDKRKVLLLSKDIFIAKEFIEKVKKIVSGKTRINKLK